MIQSSVKNHRKIHPIKNLTMKNSKRPYKYYIATFNDYTLSNIENKKTRDVAVTGNNGKPDLLNNILKDKFDTIRVSLSDIVYEIHTRSSLDHTLTGRINDEICELRTNLMELENWPIGSNMAIDKRRQNLEDKINGLEKELRNKDIRRWQDLVVLKKEFRKTFREYKDIKRKFLIIEDGNKKRIENRE